MDNGEHLGLAAELTVAWLSNPHTRAQAEDTTAMLAAPRGRGARSPEPEATPKTPSPAERTPVVTRLKSLALPDYIISMLDGTKHRSLKRHLRNHGLAGTLTQRDGQLRRNDIAPIQLDMIVGVRREALTWMRRETSTRHAAGPKGMASRLLSGLATEVGEHFYDDVLAAA